MSKVEELRAKYPTTHISTFNKFVDADKTPTKKYVEYMLKTWGNRYNYSQYPKSTAELIDKVNDFDKVLSYLDNKDIYHNEYSDYSNLIHKISIAEEKKEEKTFVKEQHCQVLLETDEFIFVRPTTHKGSMRYGASTKWCTAARNDQGTFNRYFKSGLLVYLIDKTNKIAEGGKKIAFFMRYNNNPLTSDVDVFNVKDHEITDRNVVEYGWPEDIVMKLLYIFRAFSIKTEKQRNSVEFIEKFTTIISSINFDALEKHLEILEHTDPIPYISKLKDQLGQLTENLNKRQYAVGATKN